ncbi:class I SAM-dependent methyltransferase [Blastochloris sulfoviridis]|uniref:Class I SAM-dependent methyltransferase n=1 Tax=Blastochloris sulfoviridis TaxID=50712 RepID=A0A5M6I184_9HYPH|nr:class I SAM-dependent methyltransferase [Blastochloris sulfoviridis]KAA5601933.1 class I SAM-dependent methyltransferase [Blastochloris sulfoviridis]
MSSQDVLLQREYHRRTAGAYDDMHVESHDEHALSLAILSALIEFNGVNSILDVGSGTGRALKVLQKHFPERKIVGIAPVANSSIYS